MASKLSFASSTNLQVRFTHGLAKNVLVCTAVSDGSPTVSKVSPTKPKDNPYASKYYKVLSQGDDISGLKKPPVHRSLPMIGYLTEAAFGLSTSVTRAARFGPLYESNFLYQNCFFITKHGAVMDISRDPETFRNKGAFDAFGRLFGTDCIVLTDGEELAATRSIITPAFMPSLLPFYFHSIQRRARRTWKGAQAKVAKDGRVLLDPMFREHYLSGIVEMTTGLDTDTDFATELRIMFVNMQNALFSPPFGPVWASGIRGQKRIKEVLENLIRDSLVSKADISEKLREYGDKLSYLGGKEIPNGEVNAMLIAIACSKLRTGPNQQNDPALIESMVNLILLLWIAGYATSAATTSCAAFELFLDNGIRKQLTDEQDAIIASEGGEREITYDQVTKQMPLLDAFLTEVLRMHPPVNFVSRKTSSDVEIQGHLVKKNSIVLLDMSAAMQDPEVFDEPNKLRIDRFLKRVGGPPLPKSTSFGAPGSPHHCIGELLARIIIKTTLAEVLREYNLELDPRQSKKFKVFPEETPASKCIVSSLPNRYLN